MSRVCGLRRRKGGGSVGVTSCLIHFETYPPLDDTGNYTITMRGAVDTLLPSSVPAFGSAYRTADAVGQGFTIDNIVTDLLAAEVHWTIDVWMEKTNTHGTWDAVLNWAAGTALVAGVGPANTTTMAFTAETSANTGGGWDFDDRGMPFALSERALISIEREGDYLRWYKNGVKRHELSFPSGWTLVSAGVLASGGLHVGWRPDFPTAYVGPYIFDEIRVSRISRYGGSDFAPPSMPYIID